MTRAVPYFGLKPEDFPLTIEGLSPDGIVVWRKNVAGPMAIYVPPLAKRHGCPIFIRVTYSDGRTEMHGPP